MTKINEDVKYNLLHQQKQYSGHVLSDTPLVQQEFMVQWRKKKKKGGSSTLSTSVWHLVCCIVHFLPQGEIADLLQQLLPCQMMVFDSCVRVKLMN